MDHTLRRNLIEALKSRGWTHVDAERAAAGVAEWPEGGTGEWKVWFSKVAGEPALYWVARKVSDISAFDSPLEGRAGDVASALNDLEGHDSDATGTH